MYQVNIEPFQGPLALLLSLVEERKLAIEQVGLASVTEGFLAYRAQVEEKHPDMLADFLVVVARLLYLKSKALLPQVADEEDEGPALVNQLAAYKLCVQMAEELGRQQGKGRLWEGGGLPSVAPGLPSREHLSAERLLDALVAVEKRARPWVQLPRQLMERIASVEETVARLRERLLTAARFHLHEAWGSGQKSEVITTVLALLELWKQNTVTIRQGEAFGAILVERV
jgi:segregation and condensation protein A